MSYHGRYRKKRRRKVIFLIVFCVVAACAGGVAIGRWILSKEEHSAPAATDLHLKAENFSDQISEKTETKIISKSDDSITLLIQCPDVASLLMHYMESEARLNDFNHEYERIISAVISDVESGNCQIIEREITLPVQTVDGVQEIVYTDEYYDAVNGGMLSLFIELLGGDPE